MTYYLTETSKSYLFVHSYQKHATRKLWHQNIPMPHFFDKISSLYLDVNDCNLFYFHMKFSLFLPFAAKQKPIKFWITSTSTIYIENWLHVPFLKNHNSANFDLQNWCMIKTIESPQWLRNVYTVKKLKEWTV